MNKLSTIHTQRLVLRPFTIEDVEPSYQMNRDPEITRYTGDGGVIDLKEMERRIVEDVLGDYQKYGYGRFAVEWKENGTFIGFAGLKYLSDMDEVDIGYRFLKEYWGRGIATEAGQACVHFGFDVLKLKRMIGFVIPENIGSVRVLEKLGFSYEKDMEEDGEYMHLYSLGKKQMQK